MAAGTALNESLACIALGYIAHEEKHSLEGFHTLITKTTGSTGLWGKVVARCELSDKTVSKYRDAYKDVKNQPNPWIYTSYQSAIEIEKSLNLKGQLNDYKFSKVERNVKYAAYWLKQKATSAIKKYSKEVLKNKAGILASLNADKVNIGDIFIIKNKSDKLNKIKELIEDLDEESDVRNAISEAVNQAESDDYTDTLRKHLESKLEEYGTVLKLNDEGAEIQINLQSFVDQHVDNDEWLLECLDTCGETNSECIFDEVIGAYDFEKPRWNFDDRYYPDVDSRFFNDMLSDRLSDFIR